MQFENINLSEPDGWPGGIKDKVNDLMMEELSHALKARKPMSRELFGQWYAEIEAEIDTLSATNQDPAFTTYLAAAVKKLAWTTWQAREPELALADVQVKASTEMIKRWIETKEENERLKAENKQLRWTIDHVLDGGASSAEVQAKG